MKTLFNPGALALIVILSVSASAQYVVAPLGASTAEGTASVPFFATAGATYQVQYDGLHLLDLPVSSTITGLSLRLKRTTPTFSQFPASEGLTWTNFEVTLSRRANDTPVLSTNFTANQSNPVIVRSGPLHIPGGSFALLQSPNEFGIEIPCIPYIYLGSQLNVTIRAAAATLTTSTVVLDCFPESSTARGLFANSSSATTGAFAGAAALRFTSIQQFQKNQPTASMTHLFEVTNGATPAIANACANGPLTVETSSTLTNHPHDIVIAFNPLVGRSHVDSTPLIDHQVINVPLADPSLIFLWSGGPTPAFPAFFPLSLAFNAPPAPITWCSQMIVIDPSRPSFLSLSQGTTVGINPQSFNSVSGPTGEDQFFEYRFGLTPFCAFSTMPFYDRNYDSFWVSANGKVTFGNFDNDFSATISEANFGHPSVMFWTDLTPSPGTINVVTSPAGVSVNFVGVRYNGEPTSSNTFSIELFGDGDVAISGLSGINPTPLTSPTRLDGDAQLLGITNGFISTNNTIAPFPFGTPVVGAPGQGFLDFWQGTAATAPNGLGLVSTIQSNRAAPGSLGRLDFTRVGTGYTALSH